MYHLSAADVVGYQRYFELRPDPQPVGSDEPVVNGGGDGDRLPPV